MNKNLKWIDEINTKIFAALSIFALSIVSTIVINPDNSGVTKVKSYPATVCPANLSEDQLLPIIATTLG